MAARVSTSHMHATALLALALAFSCLPTYTAQDTETEPLTCGCSISQQQFCSQQQHQSYLSCAEQAVLAGGCPTQNCKATITTYFEHTIGCFNEYSCDGWYRPQLGLGSLEVESGRWASCGLPGCEEQGGGGGKNKLSAFAVLCIIAAVMCVVAVAARHFRSEGDQTHASEGRQTVRLGKATSSGTAPGTTGAAPTAQMTPMSPAESWAVTHGISLTQQPRPVVGMGRSSMSRVSIGQASTATASPMTTIPVEPAIIRHQ